MKQDKYSKSGDDTQLDNVDIYHSGNDDFNHLRAEKSGSKWRKRPRRRRTEKDDYDDNY